METSDSARSSGNRIWWDLWSMHLTQAETKFICLHLCCVSALDGCGKACWKVTACSLWTVNGESGRFIVRLETNRQLVPCLPFEGVVTLKYSDFCTSFRLALVNEQFLNSSVQVKNCRSFSQLCCCSFKEEMESNNEENVRERERSRGRWWRDLPNRKNWKILWNLSWR